MLRSWRRSRATRHVASEADSGVSVVINTLNRRDLLEDVLDALYGQHFENFEVIVVNGPSTDGTDAMLREREGAHRVVTCEVARLGVSRNLGIAHAACPIVAFIDDDAIPDPAWLDRLVTRFADDAVGAVGGPVFDVPLGRIDWQICTCTRLGASQTNSPPPIDQYVRPGADPFAYLAGCNMSFRRSVLQEIGGFNPMFAYGYDDVDVCVRLIDRGHQIVYDEDALVTHYRAPSATRDEAQLVRDPYPIAYARTTFALQCERTKHDLADVQHEMRRWMDQWRQDLGSNESIESGPFFERFSSGIADALEQGLRERPRVHIGERRAVDFRRYQSLLMRDRSHAE